MPLHPAQLTASITSSTSGRELMELVAKHESGLNSIHASAALSHAVKMSLNAARSDVSKDAIHELVMLVRRHVPEMGSQALANSLWAIAKMRFDADVMLVVAIIDAMKPKLDTFSPQELSNTLWAMATLSHVDMAFTGALLKAATPKLDSFKPQELANTVWALATLGQADEEFTRAVLKAAKPKLSSFKPQELTNTIWALATLRHADLAFTRTLLKAAKSKLDRFNPQDSANMLWAMATLGHEDAAFTSILLKAAQPKLEKFNSQALANTLWSMATLGREDAAFTSALLKVAMPKLHRFSAQELANILWAMATLGHLDAIFITSLLDAAKTKLVGFKPQELSNTLWALATLGYADATSTTMLLQAAKSKLGSFNSQDLANALWATAVHDQSNEFEFVKALLRKADSSSKGYQGEALRQLFQVMLWADSHGVGSLVPASLYSSCKKAWLRGVGDTSTSKVQQQVLEVVCTLPGCSDAAMEHNTDDGFFSIDIAVRLPEGGKVAVEVDGPWHFVWDAQAKQHVLNGATRLRDRLLEARGWRVVSIPVVEWQQTSRIGEPAKRAFLVDLLGVGAGVEQLA